MRSKLTTSLFLLSFVLFVSLCAGVFVSASTSPTPGIELHRFVENHELFPGEEVTMRFDLMNHQPADVDYTLIEEVPVGVTVLETDFGSYNQSAGFVVWRGTLAPGEHVTIPYVLQIQADAQGVLPLYAYMSTAGGLTGGDVLDHVDQLHIGRLDWQLSLADALVQKGDVTTLQLRVKNPFDRNLLIDFSFELAEDLLFEDSLPTSIHLPAGDEWTFETVVTAEAIGSHGIQVTPHIGGVATASPKQVTVSTYDGKRPRPEKVTLENDPANEPAEMDHIQRRPVTTERVHEVRLPKHVFLDDEDLVFVARLPVGAGYVPGSARISPHLEEHVSVTPQISGEYLLFFLPYDEYVTVRYELRYEDKTMVPGNAPDENNDVGLISIGQVPRVLQGDERLLHALHGERQIEPRKRIGAVILDPFGGQVFTEREQIDIEVDGPVDSQMTLRVNETVVSRDQIGGLAENTTRLAEKYIAVPLSVGANHLELTAVTADGEVLTDSMTVYRSGPVSQLSITPVSDMVTGRVHPHLIQVAAADEDGLAPADRTPITVEISGGKLLTKDAHPDWVGHQVLLYGGRSLLEIEPLTEAGMISVTARIGEVTEQTSLLVTAHADDWFVLGLGTLRAEELLSPQGTRPKTSADFRLVARGPVGSGVFTAAIDTQADPSKDDPDTLWTGDTSSSGHLVGSGEPIHLQLERGLSYVRYGSGRVKFDGELARYNRMHTGLQSVLHESPSFSLRSFIDSEPIGRLQEIIEGDGTGYYRLAGGAIQPHSEDLTIVVRQPFSPYDIVREEGLARSEYTIDYRTGQIWLREPLLSRDGDGNQLSLRVRYNPVGEPELRTVGGLQATWRWDKGHISGTARLARDQYGEASQLYVLGGRREGPHQVTLDWEAAIAQNDRSAGSPVSTASAYALGLTHPSILGWNVRIGHRNIQSGVAAVVDGLEGEVVTSFVGERRVHGVSLAARASVSQEKSGEPWTAESQVEANWSWKGLRPTLAIKAQQGLDTPLVSTLLAGAGFNLPTGSISVSREFPFIGEHSTHDVVEGRMNLERGYDLLFMVNRETDPAGMTETRNSISFTKALEGAVANTILRGGYEYSDADDAGGAMVYSATSNVPINDAHSLQFVVDHRRPLHDQALPTFGGQLGWNYRLNEGDSTFRFDHRTDGNSVKQSVQWRGFQPVSDAWAFQLDASIFRDDDVRTGSRIRLSTAYRTDVSAVLASAATERNSSLTGEERSSEWRVKGAHYLTPDVLVNLGYAQRVTDAPTLTDKIGISLIVGLSDRYDLLVDGSLLKQHDSGTELLGSRVGLGYQLTKELSVTLGYAMADYVGFDSAGSHFSRQRSGAFVELNLSLDELTIAGWFKGRKEKE